MNIVSHTEKLRESLRLAAMGFRIFPCHGVTDGKCDCGRAGCDESKAGKHPAMVRSWTDEATTDPDTIRSWWHRQPNANVGVACGRASDLAVVDTDIRPDGDGFESLRQLDPQDRTINEWETARVRTGSGGYHIWLAWPDGCSLTVGSKIGGKNIDLRGEGGYVIAPPSVNGRGAYQWLDGPDELMQCPAWLLQFLSGGKAPSKASGGNGHGGLTFTLEHDLQTHPGAAAGERNGLLCKLVGAALASGQAPDEVMQQALAWNRRCGPPKAEAGIRKSVQALITKEWQSLRERASAPAAGIAGPTLRLPAASAEQVLICRRASDITPQALQWLWENHLQLGAVNLIAGPEGKGKSLIAVDIAARTSTGSPWPDGSDCEAGKVLYCSAEEDVEAVVVPRLMAAGAELTRIEIVDGLGSSTDEGKVIADVDLKRCLPAVHRKLAEGGFRLCIWDTFQSVCLTSDHRSNTEQKAVLQPLQAIADEMGLAMLLIEHHNRAGLSRSGGNPDSVILGGGLTRTARVIWHVIEDPKDTENSRLFLPGKMNNCARAEGLGWRFGFTEVALTIQGLPRKLPRIDWLEPAGVTIQEVQDGLNGTGSSGDTAKDEFHRAVEWLRENLTEPTSAAVMEEGFRLEGFSKTTMKRAKDFLLVKSRRTAEGWLWLPGPVVTLGTEVIADPMAK